MKWVRKTPRKISVLKNILPQAEGSCEFRMGETRVWCVASAETKLPPHAESAQMGWITAEYAMLPRSGNKRSSRLKGITGGRAQEISRLIGRSLRASTDLKKLYPYQITVDCDVLSADGGTRTAAINGGMIALAMALSKLYKEKKIEQWPVHSYIGAISAGYFRGQPVLDLSYEYDSAADADINFVFNQSGNMIEVQGTAEQKPFSEKDFLTLLSACRAAVKDIITLQKKTVGAK